MFIRQFIQPLTTCFFREKLTDCSTMLIITEWNIRSLVNENKFNILRKDTV
jgi:hypothetical protein